MDCESLTSTRGATQQSMDYESLTPTRGATQQSVECESLTPTRAATQQSVDCESLTPTRGATQQSVDSKIVPVSSIAPEGWGPNEGGNATSPLPSRGSPIKATKSEVKTYAGGHHHAPRNKAWIQRLSSIAPEGWGPNEGGNATSPVHYRGSPTKWTKSEVKTYAGGHHDAPRNKAWIVSP